MMTFEEIPAEERTDSKKDKKTNTKKDKVKQEKVKKAEPKKTEVTNGPDQFGNIYIAPTDAYPDTTAVDPDVKNEGLLIRKLASGKSITLEADGTLRDFVEEDLDTTPTQEDLQEHETAKANASGDEGEGVDAAKEYYAFHDAELNRVWAEIKAILPEAQMNELVNEQLRWIDYRDGEAAPYSVNGSPHYNVKAGLSRDRAIVLKDIYLND